MSQLPQDEVSKLTCNLGEKVLRLCSSSGAFAWSQTSLLYVAIFVVAFVYKEKEDATLFKDVEGCMAVVIEAKHILEKLLFFENRPFHTVTKERI